MTRDEYKEIIAEMYKSNATNNEMTLKTKEIYPEISYEKADSRMRHTLETLNGEGKIVRRKDGVKSEKTVNSRTEVTSENIIELLKKGITYKELSERCGFSETITKQMVDELKAKGYNIIENGNIVELSDFVVEKENRISLDWGGEQIIRFGLMGDTQINSKYTQLTHLHRLYDIYKQEGIKAVYHTGDIDEGEQMRIGHQYECYNQGADDHVKEIVNVYPKRNGITTKFITGNHDASIIKRCGYDIGVPIAEKRADMEYLGQSNAIISITPNCTLELRHPIDGTAYALSYKLQKMVEAMSGGEKPNILAVGHYHKAEYFMYRNVHCFQTACLQAQTPFMRGKGISAFMGGWIVEVHVDEFGTITMLKQEYIPFYEAIKDDWQNWR